jgi:hypothetical protein
VGERKINRDAWAQLVNALVETETRGKKATFARMVGVDPRTVSRWLASEVDVSEESVREVARRLNRPPMDLLVRVGYYSVGEVGATTPAPAPGEEDPALKKILDANVSDEMRERMLKRLDALRTAQREREAEDVQWWIDQAREA